MDKPRNYFKNTFHHLYNRGVNKANIFFDDENYLYFLRRLNYYKEKYNIRILAYCLMPNHFHLFVNQLTDEMPIGNFIGSLINSYTKSINVRYKRNGILFDGRTKSKQIEDPFYFIWVIKYILENPLKAGLIKDIVDWEYSNAKEIFIKRKNGITDVDEIISYFDSQEQMIDFLTNTSMKVNYEF